MKIDDILSGRSRTSPAREEHWIPLSDLMTGLMMVFMLVAIAFMVEVEAKKIRVEEIVVIYDKMKNDLYRDLNAEFEHDLPRWGATLSRDLTIRFKEPNRFKEPEVLFETGKDTLRPRFVQILDDFFPRYVKILSSKKYRNAIEEIRIEGHTSSVWTGATSANDAYFKNMALSQARTRSVLQRVLPLPAIANHREWLKLRLTANGLSSSKLIANSDGSENASASRRVEFRVRTNAEERIERILKAVQQ